MRALVMTFIGEDHPGLVHALAEVISDHGGNWENSQMRTVDGTFAGILELTVGEDRADALIEDLRALDGMLEVTVRRGTDVAPSTDLVFTLDLSGDDRPGIIEQVVALLARSGVNVERLMTTNVGSGFDGGRLFQAAAELRLSPDIDLTRFKGDLADLGEELMIDVTFEPYPEP